MLASAPSDRVLVVGATGRTGRDLVAAAAAERIDYGGVAHVMRALGGRRPRIVLMTILSANLLT